MEARAHQQVADRVGLTREITYFFRRISCFTDFQEIILDYRPFLIVFEQHCYLNSNSILNCIMAFANLSENESYQCKFVNNKKLSENLRMILTNIEKQVRRHRKIKMICQTLRILANLSLNRESHLSLVRLDLLDWLFKRVAQHPNFATSEAFAHLMTVFANLSSTEFFHSLYLET